MARCTRTLPLGGLLVQRAGDETDEADGVSDVCLLILELKKSSPMFGHLVDDFVDGSLLVA